MAKCPITAERVKIRVAIAKHLFGLQRVTISRRKHFDGAVFYGTPDEPKVSGIVPHYEDDWNETAMVIEWIAEQRHLLIIGTYAISTGASMSLKRSKSLPLDICKLALLIKGVKA